MAALQSAAIFFGSRDAKAMNCSIALPVSRES
jgi:hypothetical protein